MPGQVQADLVQAQVGGAHALAAGVEALVGHEPLEHEGAARGQPAAHRGEAAQLVVLGERREEGVEDPVDQRVTALDGHGGEVAHGDVDGLAARLGPQPLHDGRRGVDAVHLDAPGRQGQGHPAPASAQLQGRARSRHPNFHSGAIVAPWR